MVKLPRNYLKILANQVVLENNYHNFEYGYSVDCKKSDKVYYVIQHFCYYSAIFNKTPMREITFSMNFPFLNILFISKKPITQILFFFKYPENWMN